MAFTVRKINKKTVVIFKQIYYNKLIFEYVSGPSFAIDTACSSSLLALQQAISSIRSGQCDSAIVGGANLLLKPTCSLQFHRLNMLSIDGACKAFDVTGRSLWNGFNLINYFFFSDYGFCLRDLNTNSEKFQLFFSFFLSGNGYVRSEAVVVILLQKASVARRSYATVVHAKTNTDGYKVQGVTFPNGQMQKKLINEVYVEAKIDPRDVAYVEAHGTGTKVSFSFLVVKIIVVKSFLEYQCLLNNKRFSDIHWNFGTFFFHI